MDKTTTNPAAAPDMLDALRRIDAILQPGESDPDGMARMLSMIADIVTASLSKVDAPPTQCVADAMLSGGLLDALRSAVALLRTHVEPQSLGGERFDLTDCADMAPIFAAIERAHFANFPDMLGREAAIKADMLDALYVALPFVEDAQDDKTLKPGVAAKAAKKIRAAIERAEGSN